MYNVKKTKKGIQYELYKSVSGIWIATIYDQDDYRHISFKNKQEALLYIKNLTK